MNRIFLLDDIQEVAAAFWKSTGAATVFAFHGEMGAGKTTFIHALCDMKGVKDAVGSPTFSLVNEYLYEENGQRQKLFHIDLYRLKDEEEATRAGIEDCLYSGNICLVEWPEKAPGIFPEHTLHIFIDVLDAQRRRLRIGNN
jgi:tRNA threonylcarbamoyladenosine biosynthesis protein TsaE